MSLSPTFQQRMAPRRAFDAIQWLADPTASGREYAERFTDKRIGDDNIYPYALGEATAIIENLLDSLGYPELGPNRFDCEYAAKHPNWWEDVDMD